MNCGHVAVLKFQTCIDRLHRAGAVYPRQKGFVMTKKEKQERLDRIVEGIMDAHEDFISLAQDLDGIGRKASAEHLRDIVTAIEVLRWDLRNTIK